jgi:hypothetical protein
MRALGAQGSPTPKLATHLYGGRGACWGDISTMFAIHRGMYAITASFVIEMA